MRKCLIYFISYKYYHICYDLARGNMKLQTMKYTSKLEELEKQAIDIIRKYEPKDEIYYLAYSGGKDSDVLLHIAKKSGVKFKAIHSFTTVESRDQIRHVRKQKDVEIIYPKKTMYQLIEEKGLPTRFRRWCCGALKHDYGKGKITLTGIRKAESIQRQKRTKEYADFGGKKLSSRVRQVNPLWKWADSDIWKYIEVNSIELCKAYQKGNSRVGCLGCPLKNKKERLKDFSENPNMLKAIINSMDKYVEKTEAVQKRFRSGSEAVDWWLSSKSMKKWQFDKQMKRLL